ncbi:hypothetical protein BD310DRAFT_939661 [Dichomitus squalens]|uniref:Uncharacterized protein n=1 Tax=Dichomitus squalens TaxID=114155 RepID=A0A4Q9PD27_9APHY|nr:hypothetical protein BD310DRAFT_939661 [Dichomitus squalens]
MNGSCTKVQSKVDIYAVFAEIVDGPRPINCQIQSLVTGSYRLRDCGDTSLPGMNRHCAQGHICPPRGFGAPLPSQTVHQ